jgi:hypothetical protein
MIPQPYYKVIAVFVLAMMVAGACATGTAPEATVSSVQGRPIQPSVSEIKHWPGALQRFREIIASDPRTFCRLRYIMSPLKLR